MSGYAKAIVTAATSLIVLTYSISIKEVQNRQLQTAIQHVKSVQDEKTFDAVLQMAINHIADKGSLASNGFTERLTFSGLDVSYSIKSTSTNSAKITVSCNTLPSMFARIDNYSAGEYRIYRNGWRVTNVFI